MDTGLASRAELEKVQWADFNRLVQTILPSNAFYAAKFREADYVTSKGVESLDEFRKLPFTTKHELVQDQADHAPLGANTTFPESAYTRIHQTSGTTGSPLLVPDTEKSWAWWADCWETVYRGAGVTEDDRIFFAFSFGPFVGFWSGFAGAHRTGALAFPGGGMSTLQRLKAIIERRITVLVCTPTYALHLAEVAEEHGIDIASSDVRLTIHAGEPGASLPATREKIEQHWGARCSDHAGATEVGAWGFQCAGLEGMFVNEREFIMEVVDPETGDPAQEGELILTNLNRPGYPVIRYRTGDHVIVEDQDAGCCVPFRRLRGGVVGRIDDAIIVRGINVYPSAIENIVRRFPSILEFEAHIYRRSEMDDLEIKIELSEGDTGEAVRTLTGAIQDGVGIRVKVEQVHAGTLPRYDMKARRFKDHR